MNKTFLGILIGLLFGAGAMWFVFRSHNAGAPAKTEAAAKPEEKEKENPLHLPPEKRVAAGIAMAKPTEMTLAPEVAVFGRVLDAVPLVTLVGELETARAAGTASEKELERVKKLFSAGGNASAQAVETAEAAAARDRAATASARARLAATWGRDVAQKIESIGQDLENGAVLVRLDLLPGDGTGGVPKTAHVGPTGGGDGFEAEVLGPAPTADPQVQGASFLAVVRGHPLPAGAALRGTIPGAGESTQALIVPRSAIVYHQGSAWVFVFGEEDTFERKFVVLGRAAGGEGVVVTQGLEASEQVVTAGAQQLLAAELQAGGAPAGD